MWNLSTMIQKRGQSDTKQVFKLAPSSGNLPISTWNYWKQNNHNSSWFPFFFFFFWLFSSEAFGSLFVSGCHFLPRCPPSYPPLPGRPGCVLSPETAGLRVLWGPRWASTQPPFFSCLPQIVSVSILLFVLKPRFQRQRNNRRHRVTSALLSLRALLQQCYAKRAHTHTHTEEDRYHHALMIMHPISREVGAEWGRKHQYKVCQFYLYFLRWGHIWILL